MYSFYILNRSNPSMRSLKRHPLMNQKLRNSRKTESDRAQTGDFDLGSPRAGSGGAGCYKRREGHQAACDPGASVGVTTRAPARLNAEGPRNTAQLDRARLRGASPHLTCHPVIVLPGTSLVAMCSFHSSNSAPHHSLGNNRLRRTPLTALQAGGSRSPGAPCSLSPLCLGTLVHAHGPKCLLRAEDAHLRLWPSPSFGETYGLACNSLLIPRASRGYLGRWVTWAF